MDYSSNKTPRTGTGRQKKPSSAMQLSLENQLERQLASEKRKKKTTHQNRKSSKKSRCGGKGGPKSGTSHLAAARASPSSSSSSSEEELDEESSSQEITIRNYTKSLLHGVQVTLRLCVHDAKKGSDPRFTTPLLIFYPKTFTQTLLSTSPNLGEVQNAESLSWGQTICPKRIQAATAAATRTKTRKLLNSQVLQNRSKRL